MDDHPDVTAELVKQTEKDYKQNVYTKLTNEK